MVWTGLPPAWAIGCRARVSGRKNGGAGRTKERMRLMREDGELIVAWRRDQLTDSGFSPSLATRIAGDSRYDLHALIELDESVEQSELLDTLQKAISDVLTPHQRRVLVALALNGVPIDVLAERLNTNRNALYKTLHDARRKLRGHLEELGLSLELLEEGN